MTSRALTDRETVILEALVEAHVDLGAPVGSRALCRRAGLDLSSATVRAVLASLEEKGYVEQPHTSAGRVPTDKGYRRYVAARLREDEVAHADAEGLEEQLDGLLSEGRYDEVLEQIAHVLGGISRQLGLVLAPRFEQGVLQRLELVPLSEDRLLLVVTIRQGLVRSLVMHVSSRVSRAELAGLDRALNERLQGLSMAEIRRSVRRRLSTLMPAHAQLLRAVTEEIEALTAPVAADLHVAGAGNICRQPEFRDPFQVAGLLELVERKDVLAGYLGGRRGIVITIGGENAPQAMRRCGVVTASYEVSGALGVIGVIGPTRMPYLRVAGLVCCAASRAAALVA